MIRVSNSLLHEAFMRDGFTPAPADRSRRRPRISALALWAALTVAGGAARAQPVDCASLRAQLAAAVGEGAEQSQQFAAAADKQRSELTRTLVYARSLGCDRQQFLFFGDAPPAQCGTINARITAMRANLSNLQARAAVGSPAQRSALAARYEIYCRNGSPRQAGREKGFLENLFGERSPLGAPVHADEEGRLLNEDELLAGSPHGGSLALCVRQCDGGFFPVSYAAQRHNLDELQDLCKALCPNVDVELYTGKTTGEIGGAVSIDGRAYASMPNAFKFEKRFDPTCVCKPPGQSWVEALARAEEILGQSQRGDIVVTQEKSNEMARPRANSSHVGKAGAPNLANVGPASPDALAGGASPPQPPAPGEAKAAKKLDAGDAETSTETGPDGTKRRVRRVGPML